MVRELHWQRINLRVPPAREGEVLRVRALAPAEAEEGAETFEVDVPDLSAYPTAWAKARFLLETASEVEHALMAQYLYAAYSLRTSADNALDAAQKASVTSWRREIAGVSREEMGHLMSLQNLLLLVGAAPNFEREDMPFRTGLYPFLMSLEPLTQKSLARFVVAEAPAKAERIEDLVALATEGGTMPISRVGSLYLLLGVVFADAATLAQVPPEQHWLRQVAALAADLRAKHPEGFDLAWHLPDDAFDPGSVARQAGSEWESGTIEVHQVRNRSSALHALERISVQGEGAGLAPLANGPPAHFERLLGIFRGNAGRLPFPAPGAWAVAPALPVPIDPRIVPGSADPNHIAHLDALPKHRLGDELYRALLGALQYFFVADAVPREALVDWSRAAMRQLRGLSGELVTLRRHPEGQSVGALPFTMPHPIHLPGDASAQRAALIQRMQEVIQAAKLVQAMAIQGSAEDLVRAL